MKNGLGTACASVCLFGLLSGCTSGGSGGDASFEYTALSDTAVSGNTSVTVLTGGPTDTPTSSTGRFNNSGQSLAASGNTFDVDTALTSGLDYVTGIDDANIQLAYVPTQIGDLPSGIVTYNGTAAVNVVFGTDAYDDADAALEMRVNFNNGTANGRFSVENGTVTNSSGIVTDTNLTATATVSAIDVRSGGFESGSVALSGFGGADVSDGNVLTVGGVAGPEGAEIAGIVAASDLDTSFIAVFAGQRD